MVNGTTLWAIEDKEEGHSIPNYGAAKAIFPYEFLAKEVVERYEQWTPGKFGVVEVEIWKKEDIKILLDKAQPF